MQFPLDVVQILQACKFEDILDAWDSMLGQFGNSDEAKAELGRKDRFYLLTTLLHREDAFHPWLYARCREVEANPDGRLDLWAREHYKSTIITFAGIIQEIVRDPEITIGIFSHTNPVATKFLLQIKTELETNAELKRVYADVFYASPATESTKWGEEKGIVVRRKSNPKEATIEAHGLVDGQPTGAHFLLRVYDDVVTPKSVRTPEQVQKTTEMWSLSDNLGARGADGKSRAWHIGTRYSYADTYSAILERKALIPRLFPATHDGTPDGTPVFLTQAAWEAKKLAQISSVIACQQLMNPAAGTEAMFKKEWLKFIDIRPATLNVYIMCDPASSRKKGSDKTAIYAVGLDAGGNKWLLDGYHHKMQLSERWANLKALRKVWLNMPGVQTVEVGYERYGATSDLEYFEEQMIRDRDQWTIRELAWPRDGTSAKFDRIQRLQPDFKAGRFYLAGVTEKETRAQAKVKADGQGFRVYTPVKRMDENGNLYSINKGVIEQYLVYPFASHDDAVDCVSRIYDMEAVAPIIIDESTLEPESYVDG